MAIYSITSGPADAALKGVCYGVEGVGKTKFASKWPRAVFIDIEGGTAHYDVARLPRPESWEMLLDELMAVPKMDAVGTLVIDTADAAEALCIAKVLKDNKASGIESVGGGYGKGYTYLAEEFAKLLRSLDRIVESGKHVLLLAHAQIKKFEQPDELGAYDRWELKLQKKCAPLVKEWADLLLFANFKTDVLTSKDGKKVKAEGGKRRVIYAAHTAAWDAKNRLGLPDEMPFEFEAIADKVPEPGAALAKAKAKPAKGAKPKAGQKPKPKPEPKPEPEQTPPADVAEADAGALAALEAAGATVEEVTPPEFLQLKQLMADYQVSDAQLRDAVGSRKNNPYTDETQVADYSLKFVRDTLLKHWEAIVATIKERGEVYDDIPFD